MQLFCTAYSVSGDGLCILRAGSRVWSALECQELTLSSRRGSSLRSDALFHLKMKSTRVNIGVEDFVQMSKTKSSNGEKERAVTLLGFDFER